TGASASTTPGASRSSASSAVGILGPVPGPDSRIQEAVGHVHDEVDDHEDRGDQEDPALDDRDVALEDRRDDDRPEARTREDDLDHDGAAEEGADLETEHRHDRNEGVAE